VKYRLTIRSGSGKPFARDFEADGVSFHDWWLVLTRVTGPKEPGRPEPTEIVAAASSEHLLCFELLDESEER